MKEEKFTLGAFAALSCLGILYTFVAFAYRILPFAPLGWLVFLSVLSFTLFVYAAGWAPVYRRLHPFSTGRVAEGADVLIRFTGKKATRLPEWMAGTFWIYIAGLSWMSGLTLTGFLALLHLRPVMGFILTQGEAVMRRKLK